jgi:hypothetical protein
MWALFCASRTCGACLISKETRQSKVVPVRNLSLEPSTNKLARAEAHLQALVLKSSEAPDTEPFELTIGQPDSERWITVTLAAKELGIPELALIAGDFIQNL